MKRFALVRNGVVVDFRTHTDEGAAEFKPRLIAGIPMWRPFLQLPDPALNPDTEKLTDNPSTITDDNVTGSRSVVRLTKAELADVSKRDLRETDPPVIRGIDEIVELCVGAGVFTERQLSPELKAKLDERKALREKLAR